MNNFDQSKTTCAILFERLGPYHFARLNRLATRMKTVAVEFYAMDDTYAWKQLSEKAAFERRTLLPKTDAGFSERLLLIRRIREALEAINPDVVALPGWSQPGALAALSWCYSSGTPAVVMSASTARDNCRSRWKERMKRRVVTLCAAGLGGGTPHIEYLADLGLPRDHVFPGYDVVDNDHFAAGADHARLMEGPLRKRYRLPDRYFLASARFITKKNLPRLFDAYSRYREICDREPWKLVLLGDGPLKKELIAHIQRLGLCEHVLLPGFVQYEDLPAFYGLAGAFVHASTAEQWGLVVNEAMAAGLPVLVSDRCGCTRDLVINGKNGYAFNPYDVGGLANLMAWMAADKTERAAIAEASRQIISAWSPETFAANLTLAVRAARSAPPSRKSMATHVLLRFLMNRSMRTSYAQ